MTDERPIRIQRRRAKGFSLQAQSPDGRPVVYVGRPTIFGSPFRFAEALEAGFTRGGAVVGYADWLAGNPWACPHGDAYELHRAALLAAIPSLRGKHLACWCRLAQCCHADILLELAGSFVTASSP